jgi:hypothetical protein
MQADLPQELMKPLDEFRAWDEAIMKESEASDRVVQPLHHYSDMAALVGMVQNQELWLTSIFHLNDPSELNHGIQLASDRLDEHLRRKTKNALNIADLIKDSFCDGMLDVLEDDIGDAFGFYVASFSRSRDDLAQWRAYADDGRGVAIEIAPKWFLPTPPRDDAPITERYFVASVEYDEARAEKRQTVAVDRAVHIVEQAASRNLLDDLAVRRLFLRELQLRLAVPILWNSVTTKHPAYRHEEETRLILLNSAKALARVVRTRTRGAQIVSYIPIPFLLIDEGILQSVMIGPGAIGDPEVGVENLLSARGVDPTGRVSKSLIPYRPR